MCHMLETYYIRLLFYIISSDSHEHGYVRAILYESFMLKATRLFSKQDFRVHCVSHFVWYQRAVGWFEINISLYSHTVVFVFLFCFNR